MFTGVDDPARFVHARDLGPHFRLTPRKYASGEIDRNGSINKAGDGAVRKALSQAALSLLTRVQRWSALKAWGMAVAKRRGLRGRSSPSRASWRSSCTGSGLTAQPSPGRARLSLRRDAIAIG
jgi:transposase